MIKAIVAMKQLIVVALLLKVFYINGVTVKPATLVSSLAVTGKLISLGIVGAAAWGTHKILDLCVDKKYPQKKTLNRKHVAVIVTPAALLTATSMYLMAKGLPLTYRSVKNIAHNWCKSSWLKRCMPLLSFSLIKNTLGGMWGLSMTGLSTGLAITAGASTGTAYFGATNGFPDSLDKIRSLITSINKNHA